MATLTYSNPAICSGGGHVSIDVALNGNAVLSATYEVDELRAPLSDLDEAEREALALAILKLHFAGKTRAQMRAEFQAGPVTVTL